MFFFSLSCPPDFTWKAACVSHKFQCRYVAHAVANDIHPYLNRWWRLSSSSYYSQNCLLSSFYINLTAASPQKLDETVIYIQIFHIDINIANTGLTFGAAYLIILKDLYYITNTTWTPDNECFTFLRSGAKNVVFKLWDTLAMLATYVSKRVSS